MSTVSSSTYGRRKPKLLDQVRYAIRTRHYSLRTAEASVRWIRRFILFHDKRHPQELGTEARHQFLSDLLAVLNGLHARLITLQHSWYSGIDTRLPELLAVDPVQPTKTLKGIVLTTELLIQSSTQQRLNSMRSRRHILRIDYQRNRRQDHSCQSPRNASWQVSCLYRNDNRRLYEISQQKHFALKTFWPVSTNCSACGSYLRKSYCTAEQHRVSDLGQTFEKNYIQRISTQTTTLSAQ